jgi:hypothetical protein
MNNKYFFSVLCLTVLAFAPACKKEKPAVPAKEEIKTMIELDNTVFETEEKKSIVKF